MGRINFPTVLSKKVINKNALQPVNSMIYKPLVKFFNNENRRQETTRFLPAEVINK